MIHNANRTHRRLGQSAAAVIPPCPPNMVRVPGGLGIGCATPAWLATATPADLANLQALEPEEEAFYTTSSPGPAMATPPPASTPATLAPLQVTPSPVVQAPPVYPAPGEAFPYSTADLETITNEMAQYGDTWDNPNAILSRLYASGIAPGTVTPAIAFSSLTSLTAAAAATPAPASVLSSPSTWPWYYWLALAGGGFFLLGGKKKL